MDYRDTLTLPSTGFKMRANLPQQEPQRLKFWKDARIYRKMLESRRGEPSFILHDGPPYANGEIHLGHALNKVLKDMVVKYRHMRGSFVPFVPGWDCHGLPIEIQCMGEDKDRRDRAEIRRKCRNYALKFVEKQKKDFMRLGVLGEWDDPYLTLKPEYEAKQLEIFAAIVERGLVYRALKPIYWCPSCLTALAEAEVEYHDHESPSITVAFRILEETSDQAPSPLLEALADKAPQAELFAVIWTTTPWTLPGNVAIAVHPEYEYVLLVEEGGRRAFLTAAYLAPSFMESCGIEAGKAASFEGRTLENLLAQHPFLERTSRFILADYVTLDSGTGLVHIAPGHGQEDYMYGKPYGLPVLSPVDEHGRMTDEAGPFGGLHYEEANEAIIEHLERSGVLLARERMSHTYPHCWRCKKPVIFRASPQWFIGVNDEVRTRALESIEEVEWIPAAGSKRISSMIENRPDWCISRQRVWGVPIPAFHCTECGEAILDPAVVRRVAELVRERGSLAWETAGMRELLPEGYACPACGSSSLEKEDDIMDVWFDSGVSHFCVLETREELSWPADLYLEGSDQHRGWFQTSLLTSVAAGRKAPYRSVLTHGFVVDEKGQKMSKSRGNVIKPQDVTKRLGADILRMWIASSDYSNDIKISDNILKQNTDSYRRIRNTLRFLLGNLHDFTPGRDEVPRERWRPLDEWMEARLNQLLDTVTSHFEEYRFYHVFHQIHNFCAVELSAVYLDVIKDRLYCDAAHGDSRRAAQTILWKLLDSLCRAIAPILSFTAEEVWEHIPNWPDKPESVFLADWPRVEFTEEQRRILDEWRWRLEFRKVASKAMELARADKLIGQSLEAELHVRAGEETAARIEADRELLEELCIVSGLHMGIGDEGSDTPYRAESEELGVSVEVRKARGAKCLRCWKWRPRLTPEDSRHPSVCDRCAEVLENMQAESSCSGEREAGS